MRKPTEKNDKFITLSQYVKEVGMTRWLSTNILPLDIIMGKGMPMGRIIEIFGAESAGKTTLSLVMMKALQEAGGYFLYVDAESALCPERAINFIGIDPERCIILEENVIEKIFQYIDDFIEWVRSKDEKCPIGIMLDSIAGTTTEQESKGDYIGKTYSEKPIIISRALRRLSKIFSRNNVFCILVNQTREIMNAPMYGEKERTPGGKAIKFHASIRIKVSKRTTLVSKSQKVGILAKLEVKKNKVAPSDRWVFIPIYYDDRGIPNDIATFAHLKETKIVEKTGIKNIVIHHKGKEIAWKDWNSYISEHKEEIAEDILSSMTK